MIEKFKKLTGVQQILAVAALLAVIYFIYKVITKQLDEAKKNKIINDSVVTGTVSGGTSGGVPVSIDLGTKATAIHSAFNDNDWFGISENEEAAMKELLNVPKQFIRTTSPNLQDVYYSLFKTQLKADFQQYLSAEQYDQVSYMFN